MKRTPLPSRTEPMKRTPINPVSAKRRAKAEHYRQAKDTVRARAHDMCELGTPDCTRRGVEAHHLKGRVGDLLCDERFMRWTCRECHDYVGAHPAESYARGWMVRRLGGAA